MYKEPEDVDENLLLDYMIVLAVSGRYYGDFDPKSQKFIEKSLDLIEQRFTGTDHVKADRHNKIIFKH